MLSIAAVGVIAAGLVGGAFTPSAGAVDTADRLVVDRTTADRATANRDAAAQRADRSGRTTPQPLTTPSTAPSTAPSVAPTSTPTAAPTVAPAPPSKPDWVSPMPGVPLSSCYGMRAGTLHQGIDFAGNAGTAIHAVGAGTVVATGWIYTGYGISVVIDHGNGYLSHYAHASQTLVQVGQKVTPGQTIALEGATGDATGPHLHFEIHQGMWNQIDPAPWLRAHGVPVGC
jgi:murein DD-endopeptidase MepM/ murein hydrolase activator NlpD